MNHADAIVASYAGIFILMAVFFSIMVIRYRRSHLIGIGDGGDKQMSRLIRVHGNFIENAPLLILAMIILARLGAAHWLLHLIGGLMLLGRVLHAMGLYKSGRSSIHRVAGMGLSFTALIISAIALLTMSWL